MASLPKPTKLSPHDSRYKCVSGFVGECLNRSFRPEAGAGREAGSARAQHTESAGFGLVSPNSGRSRSPTTVPAMAVKPHSQPCRLKDAMPPK